MGSLDRAPAFADHVQRRALAAGLRDRVHFAGPRTGAALDSAYAAADLLVLASRGETYGMVVTEALARGVPVLATDVGGVPEALGHGGLLVPARRPGGLRRRAAPLARGRRAARAAAAGGERAARDLARLGGHRVGGRHRAHGGGEAVPGGGRNARGGGGMSATAVRTFPEWLRLREPADAEARSGELVEELRRHLPAGPLVIHDLGGGSGAMGRWLAPRLPQPQHWVVHDRDEDLLALAVADPAGPGSPSRRGAATSRGWRPDALAGADVVVASALLDMLTADELRRMLAACAGRPLLIAMTVTGRVSFAPPEPLDVPLGVAFNAHQRRDGRLGPDAVPAALDALGGEVLVRPSPWHLGTAHAELMTAWFGGWVDAACEKEPELASEARAYRERRLAQAHEATVDHADLLVLP